MFINNAFAQAADTAAGAAGTQSPMLNVLFQIVFIGLIIYFLLIRPNQKRYKQHQAMLDAIKVGDEVLTGGGIYAKVVKVDGPYDLTVELSKGVEVKINRLTVRSVVTAEEAAAPANSNKKSKKS